VPVCAACARTEQKWLLATNSAAARERRYRRKKPTGHIPMTPSLHTV